MIFIHWSPTKWRQVGSDRCDDTRMFLKDLNVLFASLARRFENLHTLSRLKLPSSSIEDGNEYQTCDSENTLANV